MDTFTLDGCIRGHHISKSFWEPFLGETLSCKREIGNASDSYAVAVIKAENKEDAVVIVGHVPRKISPACSVFLGREGSSIICTVCPQMLGFCQPSGSIEALFLYTCTCETRCHVQKAIN